MCAAEEDGEGGRGAREVINDKELEGDGAMSVLFAQMQSPAYNMVQGLLLQLLLIQTQHMKRELLRQMHALDTLLRENFFTHPCRRSPGRARPGWRLHAHLAPVRQSPLALPLAPLVKQVRSVMRDAERFLIRNIAARRGRPRRRQRRRAPERRGHGLLVISLHVLRQTVERHMSSFPPASALLFEDLEDFESEQYDCEGKMLILQRIYRTQPLCWRAAARAPRALSSRVSSGQACSSPAIATDESSSLRSGAV